MYKQEILNYLLEKRKITAPVAIAENNLLQAEKNLNKAKSKLQPAISFFILFGVGCIIYNLLDSGTIADSFLYLIAALAIHLIREKVWVAPAMLQLTEAQQLYESERSVNEYIEGVKGFPEKFYNYNDVYRLWKLIDEGRASTLPEAYNLLENQHFQEAQLSKQEEFAALQADIARNARIAANSSMISAINSFK
ncbi:hypothetical protein [Facklamia hominis]|uniref:hypothetical protein n=1 Tax=Facklamia hominis TaxID=178214 RepID=UPI00101C2B24|nr:hypothetical protein [Facklamia hominis]RYC98130.1 hypothetical protein EKN08_04945 [Facklamia hominis]